MTSARKNSRQVAWQRRKVAAGRCAICGKLLHLYHYYCDEHAAIVRKWARERARKGLSPDRIRKLERRRAARLQAEWES